ncbi:MAG: peptidase domain-containing ABC transporter [Halioglobus sp.]|nr:peptidase domain-containing ABC transporter [Halioglobus sp.]
MSTIAGTTGPGYSFTGSERLFEDPIVRALREEDLDAFAEISPYAACLFPILDALGRKGINRELLESVPHFAGSLDLVDLRNILVNLGYESDSVSRSANRIRAELFPALFTADNGDILVLTDRDDDTISFFDANRREYRTEKAEALKLRGKAYLFTDKHPTHGVRQQATPVEWFSSLAGRFRKMVLHLLLMTFVINMTALAIPIFIMVIYDKVIGAKSLDSLPMILVGVAVFILADLVLRYQKAKAMGAIAGRLDYLIGVETFKQLLFLPPVFTERSTVSAQLSRLKQFDSLRDFFTGPSAGFVLDLPFVFIFILAVGVLAGPVALVPLVMLVVYVVIALLFRPLLERKVLRSGKARTDKQTMLMQTFDGRREIKAIGGEGVWRERFREVSGEAVHSNYDIFVANALMTNISQALMTLCGVSVLALGAVQVMEGNMSVGALIATMTLAWRVLTPLQGIFLSYSKLQQMFKSIAQINNLMRLKVEKEESHVELHEVPRTREIELDRVSFRYDASSDPALLGVSFKVNPGEMVAVVGLTGSGKSTLLKLIAGMYKPQAGALLLDGVDLRQLDSRELRRAIAYVPQEIRMFHGTIAQNIRLNNCLATDEKLVDAAEKAGILEDILALPEGFNTRIGDKSVMRYPPGFMRSLSLARAFSCEARVLLLDEPGASLDTESDMRFVEHLRRLKTERTVVMVSHRPSHIRLADKAVLLNSGSVQYVGEPDKAIELLMSTPS